MTSLSENDSKNEINIDSNQCPIENEHSSLNNNDSLLITTVIQKSSDNDQKQEELNEKGQSNDLTSEIEETDITNEINNNDALVNTSPSIVTTNEEQKQQEKEATQSTVNHDEHEHGSRKLFNSKFKYSSMPYHRSSYYTNGHPYGPAPYYYYSIPPSLFEKPTPLMFIPTLQPSSSSSSSSPSSSRDNQNGNSTTISPQNLPPRLRQTSITENESNLQVSSTTLPSTSSSSLTTTNGRRHHHYRSILPRGSSNYYSSHLPPPLMATPPGVLYTYPPTVHQPGHIAYNIRPVDEFEYLAFQQQMMNLPPTPLLWPPPPPPSTPITSHGHPYFPSYPINELPSPSAYMLNNTTMTQSTNSFLNPEAAEWIPLHNDNELSSRDNNNNILINDEINFPPLNSTTINNSQTISNINNHIENDSEQIDASSEIPSTNNNNNNNNSDNTNDISQIQTDNSNILSSQSNSKIESTNTSTSSSSQDDNNNKPLSSSPIKITPITYSTIISQTSENNKTNKTNTNTQQQQQQRRQPQQQSTNHIHNQLPPRDRTTKQQQQQRTQNNISSTSFSNTNSHRRQSFNNNRNNNRNILSSETNSLPKQQQQQQPQINDDWIEVKSKKTKKFDRVINDNSSEKLILDEQIHKSVSPPLSLTSTGENTTTTTFTSEDDFDEKDHMNNDLVIIMDNHVTNDYNQIIVDDIHRRLDNNERLLIIMRGCPGSGKSTLAKSLNHGYNGLILSADDYFTDNNLNKYTFDSNKLDDAHRYTCRRATDALKRNISPIIIDNTNTQTWEMKPYVAMGKEAGYDILLVEPQTPWRYKARELFKRNVHNLPIRRIKEMLNRFEHNITVQNIINQIPSLTITNNLTSTEQQNVNKNNEIIDSLLISKKFYNIIDDSLIIDDVRLCINDMILFLTSNFYQTTLLSSTSILTTTTTTVTTTSQPSSPLSVSFHDLSLISTSSSSTTTTTSLPPTPSTSHTRFHRPLTRFSFSSTTNQDHSFNTEHILRIPSSTFSRCIDTTNLTPQLSTQSNIIGKKRRKNKNKQQSNEILLNVNNNNNNNMDNEEDNLQQQPTFHVILPEECSDFVVIDENNDNDWIDNVNRNFDIQINSLKNHSSTLSHQQKQLTNPKNYELLNIIHNELNKPLHNSSLLTKHIGIQCSSNDFNSQINHSDRILIGHLSSISTQFIITSSLSPLPGYNECGIQVDLIDNNIDLLIDIYSNHLSIETIQQFYEICHFDIQWTRTQIDEYLQNNNIQQTHILTLQQLCLNVLNQWNEQIKSINPLVDIKSIDDLLQDINDDEIFEELTLNNTNIEYIDINQINIPLTMINSLEELYGELPNKSMILSNNNILLPLDNNLSINIYQALQRFLIKSNQIKKPVIENQIKKTKNSIQQWKLSSDNQLNSDINTNHIPSLKQIMNEEQQQQQVVKSQKSKQKCQLDYATEFKLKELERHFPTLDSDLLYDIFHENEYNYEITLVCISKMFDENTSITNLHKSSSIISTNSISTRKKPIEPVLESYENLRRNVFHHAQQRKEFYIKAQQANHHGMSCVASFYIHRASEETQLMKNANRIAYERLLCWKLEQYHQTKRIDLHGLHLTEALNLFKQIEQEFNEENQRTTPKSIEIITDYGKNSIYGGGHGKIHSAILAYLQQQNYKYSEPNKGVILLQLTNVRN